MHCGTLFSPANSAYTYIQSTATGFVALHDREVMKLERFKFYDFKCSMKFLFAQFHVRYLTVRTVSSSVRPSFTDTSGTQQTTLHCPNFHAPFVTRSRLNAALTNARCENACGVFPNCSPLLLISSENIERWFPKPSVFSKRATACSRYLRS